MSVHTLIKAKITDGGDLTALLTASGIAWKNTVMYEKQRPFRKCHRAIEIVVGGERIWISQLRPGEPFVFQSENARFATRQNQRAVAELASIGHDADWKKIRSEAERVKEEQRAKHEEDLRIARQKRAESAARAAAALREKRLAEERTSAEAAAKARKKEITAKEAEEKRQRDLDAEAASIVAALSVDNSREESIAVPREDEGPAVETGAPTPELEALVNRLSQATAKAKVLEAAEELQHHFGLYIHAETVLDDQTIEITLRN